VERAEVSVFSRISLRSLIPSIEDVLFITIAIKLLPLGNAFLRDADTAWHIRAGDVILQHLSVPGTDVFSYTARDQPWINHEWLSQVIFSILHHVSGLTGVVVLTTLLLCFTFYYFYRFLLELGISLLLAVILTLLAATITSVHWLARPHIFSLLLTLVWYRQLERYRRSGARFALYSLPLMMLFWVNLHGAYVTGFILLGIYLAGTVLEWIFCKDQTEKERLFSSVTPLSIVAGACVLTALVNPYGYRLLIFPFQFMSSTFIRDYINEWASPNFHETIFYELPLMLLFVVLGCSLRKLRFVELGLVLVWLHGALYAVRYMPVLAIIVLPIIGTYLEDYFRKGLADEAVPSWVRRVLQSLRGLSDRVQFLSSSFNSHSAMVIFVFLLFGLTLFHARTGRAAFLDYQFDDTKFPIKAVEFVTTQGITGHMYNSYYFGGYLIYHFYPDPGYRVFIDGRAEVYGDKILKAFIHVDGLFPDWASVLDNYGVTWIIHQAGSQLSTVLLENPGWKLIYADSVANIFVKDIPENRRLIDRFPDVKPAEVKDEDRS
jgi:hypothetical protein